MLSPPRICYGTTFGGGFLKLRVLVNLTEPVSDAFLAPEPLISECDIGEEKN